MSDQPANKSRKGWIYGIAILVVLILLLSSIPSVRASVSTWLGLSVAPSDQVPAAAATLVVIETGNPAISQQPANPQRPAEINALSATAGWDVLFSEKLPEGYTLKDVNFDTNQKLAVLTYLATKPLPGSSDPSLTSTRTITLLEALKNNFVPMQVAPETSVEDIQVNGLPGVYAVGAWDTQFVKDDKDPNGGKMVSNWRNDLKIQNVFWQDGNVFLVLVSDDESLTKEDLLKMAAGVTK